MKRVLVFLKDYKKECVLAPLFKMTEAIFELFVPLVIASMIDIGIQNGDRAAIIKDFFLLILLAVIGLTVSLTAQFFSAKAATGFSMKLRQSLFQHLMGLSFTEIDRLGASTLIARMTNDVNQAQTGVNMFLRLFLRSPFVVFGAMIMAFTIDFKAALIFVFAIISLSIVVSFITYKNIKMIREVRNKLDLVLLKTRENLVGLRVMRAFCREEQETEEFYSFNENLATEQKKAGGFSGLMNPLTYILINIGIVILIHTGSIEVSLGLLSQGAVVALYNYMSQILIELVKLANLIVTLTKAVASMQRISAVLEMESSMKNGSIDEGSIGDVEFCNVSLTYSMNAEASLNHISFKIKKGQIVGIIGGTGSGKSSLVHLLPRFYDCNSGSILLNGRNIQEYDLDFLREKVSIVMQKAAVLKGTIRENLSLRNQNATEEELWKAIEVAQATDVVKAKGGLDGYIEQNGRNLSGGQKQRLSIARALVGNPELLILDDSSSALDYVTDQNFRTALRKWKEDRSIVIVSQRTAALQDADFILVMEDGEVAGLGSHTELLNNCEVYREIYESQYGNKNKGGEKHETF